MKRLLVLTEEEWKTLREIATELYTIDKYNQVPSNLLEMYNKMIEILEG